MKHESEGATALSRSGSHCNEGCGFTFTGQLVVDLQSKGEFKSIVSTIEEKDR